VSESRLAVAGYRVVRFTYRQILSDPDTIAATLRALLVQPVLSRGAR
jgi:very-short-patch-repair endonuclease